MRRRPKMRKLNLACIAFVALILLGILAFGPVGKTALSHGAKAAMILDPLAAPQDGGFENGTNRRGYDYKDYAMSEANPNACRSDCMNDPLCKAYTYVMPGVQGQYAHCWLK